MLKNKDRCPPVVIHHQKDVVKNNKIENYKLYKLQKILLLLEKGLKNYLIWSILTLAGTGNVSNPKKVPKL